MFAYYVRKTILKIHKGVIRAYKSRKDILYKDQNKNKNKKTLVYETLHRELKKNVLHEPDLKPEVNSGIRKVSVPASLAASFVLQL